MPDAEPSSTEWHNQFDPTTHSTSAHASLPLQSRGLSLEVMLLESPQPRTTSGEMTTASASQFIVEPPRIPETFHGEAYEDVKDWLEQYECVTKSNHWTIDQKLPCFYIVLAYSAGTRKGKPHCLFGMSFGSSSSKPLQVAVIMVSFSS